MFKTTTISGLMIILIGFIIFSCRNEHPGEPSELKVKYNTVDSLNTLSWNLRNNNPSKSEQISLESLRMAGESGYTEGMSRSYRNLGVIYKNQGRYIEAYEMLNMSLAAYKKLGNIVGIAYVKNNLGSLFFELENYDEALGYFTEILSGLDEKKYSKLMGHEEYSKLIGKVYLNSGNIKVIQKDFRDAYDLYFKSLKIFQEINDTINLAPLYLNIGDYFEQSDTLSTIKAKEFYLKSRQLAEINKIPFDLMNIYFYLGRLYIREGRYDEALSLLTDADLLADSLNNDQKKGEISSLLSNISCRKGDFEKAYQYLALGVELEKSLKQGEANRSIARNKLNEQMAIAEMNLKIKNRQFNYSLIGLFIAILLIVAVYRNFRNKQKANRLLTEMDELKTRLFSNITHEFRTPLTLILGPLEEMLAAGEKKSPARNEIEMMRRNANRLLTLINQMLDLAKLDAKSLKIELTEADFIRFMRVRFYSFNSLADKKKIRFSVMVPDEIMVTFFDSDKLEKIVNNLLSNAFKFTGQGGEIVCGLKIIDRKKKIIELFVSDTGKGIPENQLNKIFDRFHQVDGSAVTGDLGTGIGLSLTKELVGLLHGEIIVESTLGKGTRFSVSVPLGKNHLEKDEFVMSKSTETVIKPAADKIDLSVDSEDGSDSLIPEAYSEQGLPIVLTIEDQNEIREYIREHLADSFSVIEAVNGKQGFQAAIRNIPDLVITDLMMPEMDGVELCKKLKTDERSSHIPVIMLTGKASAEERMEGIETGADAYLTKPFNIKELRLVAKKLIEQRQKLRERFSRDVKLEPKDIAITSADEKFLNRALEVIETHIGDSEFEVNQFQDDMAMSRMQLFRKIKALTDQSPGEFIRTIRLKRAAKLIEQGFGNIAEVTYEVGFNNPSYFAKCFKDFYGCLPSDYTREHLKS